MSVMQSWVEGGLTAKGSDFITKDQFTALIREAGERGVIVSNVEAFDIVDQLRFFSTDYSFSFSDDRIGVDWSSKVRSSLAYASDVIGGAPPGTVFKVWLQREG